MGYEFPKHQTMRFMNDRGFVWSSGQRNFWARDGKRFVSFFAKSNSWGWKAGERGVQGFDSATTAYVHAELAGWE